ncbi:MAG: hypothetical protein H0W88_03400 [Parachlamydiaceae bacterium]|nr:hypothetical protein [Parachlamydiaceae bacterium]
MNKYLFRILLVVLLIKLNPLMSIEGTFEIRSAAFFHASNRFRDIYENVGVSYQLETSAKFYDNIEGWGNLDWYSKKGKSIGFSDPTRVNILNVSFGIKFPYQLTDQFIIYGGFGPSLSRIWLKNKSECTHDDSLSKLCVGGVLKTGIIYSINRYVFIDFFADYLYQPVKFERQINIGGLKAGLGVGIKY